MRLAMSDNAPFCTRRFLNVPGIALEMAVNALDSPATALDSHATALDSPATALAEEGIPLLVRATALGL
jgi:hypothetical protein